MLLPMIQNSLNLHGKAVMRSVVDAENAMKVVVSRIAAEKKMAPVGGAVFVGLLDFDEGLSPKHLSMTMKKLEQDYRVIEIFNLPVDDPEGSDSDYDPFDDRPTHLKENYGIKINDGFYAFADEVLNSKAVIAAMPDHLPAYISIMLDAVQRLGITDDNQPPKKTIEAWLEDNYPHLSGNDRSAMATFMRDPEKKKGDWSEARDKKAAGKKS